MTLSVPIASPANGNARTPVMRHPFGRGHRPTITTYRRERARSPGPCPSPGVTLLTGITSRPAFDPAPIGMAGGRSAGRWPGLVEAAFSSCMILPAGVSCWRTSGPPTAPASISSLGQSRWPRPPCPCWSAARAISPSNARRHERASAETACKILHKPLTQRRDRRAAASCAGTMGFSLPMLTAGTTVADSGGLMADDGCDRPAPVSPAEHIGLVSQLSLTAPQREGIFRRTASEQSGLSPGTAPAAQG